MKLKNHIDLRYLLWILALLHSACGLAPSPEASKLKACTYDKAYKMYGAHCSGLDLYSVPTTLKTNIEILDLSANRIRILKNESFKNYQRIRFLYLSDNMIMTIEPEVFDPIPNLEVLDLTLNGMRTIPTAVFNLQYLRRLYFADNELKRLNNDLDKMVKPLKAPLIYLTLANCKLDRLPDFGVLPDLVTLNVSGNSFHGLTPANFSGMCSLQTVDLTGSYQPFDGICKNRPFFEWFTEKKITMVPEINSVFDLEDFKSCPAAELTVYEEANYALCKSLVRVKISEKQAKKTWIIVAGCLGGFLLVCVIFLAVMHKQNKNGKKRKAFADAEAKEDILQTKKMMLEQD